MNNNGSGDNISELLKTDLNKGFRLVVEKYSSKLYWHIRRLVILHEDADDALQNTFINAWRNIGDFRSESSFYTWIYTIATNEALTLINKRKKMLQFLLMTSEAILPIHRRAVRGSTVMKLRLNSRMQSCYYLINSVLYLILNILKK